MNDRAGSVQVHLEVADREAPGHAGSGVLRWLFAHRADLLAALVYGCLAYLSFNALADYANAHHLFPRPYGGWAFAVAIDGAVLYAFISFRRAPLLASLLLVAGAATSFVLQQWHASNDHHPAVVAGVVPAAMVLVTFAWHRIRLRPDWNVPTPLGKPVPEPTPEPVPEPEPVPQARPRATQDAPRRERPVVRGRPFTPADHEPVRAMVEAGRTNKAEMARELGLHKRGQLDLGRYVNHLRDQQVQAHRNGTREHRTPTQVRQLGGGS